MTYSLSDAEGRLDELLSGYESLSIGDLAVLAEQITVEVTSALNADSSRIKRIVDKFRQVVEKVAKDSDARSFTITVEIPLGLSVAVEWEMP